MKTYRKNLSVTGSKRTVKGFIFTTEVHGFFRICGGFESYSYQGTCSYASYEIIKKVKADEEDLIKLMTEAANATTDVNQQLLDLGFEEL